MKSRFLAGIAGIAVLAALGGCGGGGGGGGGEVVEQPAPITLGQLQGFWNGPASGADFGGASTVRSVVLADGSAWLFLHDAQDRLVGLSTADLSVSGASFSGSGTRYPASGDAAGSVSLSGAGPQGNALAVTVVTASGSTSLALAADERFTTAAQQADATGTWDFTKQGNTIQASWSVAANGALTGSSTLGCTYGGQVVPRAGVAVFDVTVAETCAATTVQLSGIGKLNSAKTVMTFGLTTTDGAKAEAFAALKR